MAAPSSPDVAFDPCPCETVMQGGAPSQVSNVEKVIRSVPLREHLDFLPDGTPHLVPAHWSKQDLEAKKGRSASVLRDCTPKDEVLRRSIALNKEPAWQDDPVSALASVENIRAIVGLPDRREVCVFAEPTTDANDPLGACATHAGIIRALPFPDEKQRVEWLMIRTKLCDQFKDIKHHSGGIVTP